MVLITSAAGFYLGSLRSGISPFNTGMLKAIGGIAVDAFLKTSNEHAYAAGDV